MKFLEIGGWVEHFFSCQSDEGRALLAIVMRRRCCTSCTAQVSPATKNCPSGTFPVAQWLRIHLPVQGTWVQSLVQEDPTCHRAAEPMCHNY